MLVDGVGDRVDPPRTTMLFGFNRINLVWIALGIESAETSRTGAPSLPATGAAGNASGKLNPLAICTTGTPGAKLAAEIAADVENRSEPDKRDDGTDEITDSKLSNSLVT